MKKIAIVGAGFAGLAAAVFALEQGWKVEVFDAAGVGGGASGVASGLLHPYPGKMLRRSKRADEAMCEAKKLLELASHEVGKPVFKLGIVRRAVDESQAKLFAEKASDYADLEWDGQLHIKSGMTVYSEKYLEGLWRYCEKQGAVLRRKKVEQVPKGFDAVILAAGYGMLKLTDLPLSCTKGQMLECEVEEDSSKSIIGDGYLGLAEKGWHLGSTYEHKFTDEASDLEQAKALILPRARRYLKGKIVARGVKAGVRVARRGDYYPISCEIQPKVYALTGFGSRGLLYHALLAKELVLSIPKVKCQS